VTCHGRASILVAAFVVALACSLSAAAPARVGADTAFREVAILKGDVRVQSDGVRFVLIRSREDPPWVFDTLAGRSFQPTPPFPDCQFVHVAGGVVLWRCVSPRYMLTDLATGAAREPAGWAAVEAMESPYSFCGVHRIGRYWLQGDCGGTLGPRSDPFYLNHRTGLLRGHPSGLPYLYHPLIDLDYAGLVRQVCAPLKLRDFDGYAPPLAFELRILDVYAPPFGLELRIRLGAYDEKVKEIRLRRCDHKRAELLSRCRSGECVAPRLGSRYATWGEDERVFAYLPRIRRRVLVGRAPAELHGSRRRTLDVEHTCNHVFAEWSRRLYVARFKPRRGAPPCQAGS
jgi:hypothetical protein